MTHSIFGLPVGLASAWIFNCYVIEGDDGPVLVDPGLPMVATRAIELIDRLGHDPASIRSVMCTHGHSDHVGGVSTIVAAADASVHLPELCRSYLEGATPERFPIVESSLRFMAVYAEQPFSFAALREFAAGSRTVGFGGRPKLAVDFLPSGFLAEGDTMPGAPGWEVIAAPGHTDDSTCLYHRDTATLISGDAVVTQGGAAWFNPEYVSLDVARETEEKLRSLEVCRLLPGHGRPIEAGDVWATARSPSDRPIGDGILARCSRRLGSWTTRG